MTLVFLCLILSCVCVDFIESQVKFSNFMKFEQFMKFEIFFKLQSLGLLRLFNLELLGYKLPKLVA